MTAWLGTATGGQNLSLARRRQVPLLMLGLSFCNGCFLARSVMRGAEVPHVKGAWSGRLVPLTVYDFDGNSYQAIAIEIEEGTRWPYGSRTDGSSQSKPLLTRHDGGPMYGRIIQPEPRYVGKEVRVSGWMYLGAPNAPKGAPRGDVAVSRQRAANEVPAEYIIMLRTDPRMR